MSHERNHDFRKYQGQLVRESVLYRTMTIERLMLAIKQQVDRASVLAIERYVDRASTCGGRSSRQTIVAIGIDR